MNTGGFSKVRLGRMHDVMAGMKDTAFSVPTAKVDRLATCHVSNLATGAIDD